MYRYKSQDMTMILLQWRSGSFWLRNGAFLEIVLTSELLLRSSPRHLWPYASISCLCSYPLDFYGYHLTKYWEWKATTNGYWMQAIFYLAFQFFSALLSGKVTLGISRKIQTWISLNCLSTWKLAVFVLIVKWFVRLDAVIAPFVTDVLTDLITIAHGSIIVLEKGTTPTFIYSWPLNAFTYSRLSWYPYSVSKLYHFWQLVKIWNLNFSTMFMLSTKIERTTLGISTLAALEFSWLLSLRFSLHLSCKFRPFLNHI